MHTLFRVSAEPTARISPRASILGDVTIGPDSSVFGGAFLRGDVAPIVVGSGSNIQECAVVHVDEGVPCVIGNNVTVGHGAVVHGCRIDDWCMVGMGSIVMNGAHLGEGCLVAAGALVPQGKEFPPRSLIVGVPGKVVRTLSDEDFENLNRRGATDYVRVSAQMVAEGAMFHPDENFKGQV